MASVSLDNVTKTFGNTIAVDNVSLEVSDGESITLLGPSGCGKTTILRMISGLDDPTEGNIFINGRVVNKIHPKDRDIAMVFQNYALYPHMTVYENISFGLRTRGIAKKEIQNRVRQVAKMLEIEKLLKRKPKELSGGEKQRTALGRAIARNPEVFLMDEPMSNLDAQLRAQTRIELIKLHRQLRTTMVYVTHDQTEAMTLGQRVAVMKNGKILQTGSPKEIYENPNSIFVAGFIGSPPMNFFQVNVKYDNGSPFLLYEDTVSLPVPEKYKERIGQYTNIPLTVGVRPEDITIELTEIRQKAQIPVLIDVVEMLGADNYVTLITNKDSLVARINSRENTVSSGNMSASWDPARMHIFDARTEQSIL